MKRKSSKKAKISYITIFDSKRDNGGKGIKAKALINLIKKIKK